MMQKKIQGFTLLETLLAISTVAVLAAIGIPIYQSFQNRNDLDIAATTFAQAVRRAQALSQAVDGDSSWGVRIMQGDIALFKGATYASRDTTYDEDYAMSTSIALSTSTQDYIFSKMIGDMATSSSIVLTSSNNETRTLSVNTKGMVTY